MVTHACSFQSQLLLISTAFFLCFSTEVKPLGPKSAPGLPVHGCTQEVLGLMH